MCVSDEYEHSLNLKSTASPITGRGRPNIFPVNYEHHLHTKHKAISITALSDL
jgi:hypothetical protein